MNTLGETAKVTVTYNHLSQHVNNGYEFIAVVEEANHDGYVVCAYNPHHVAQQFVTWTGVPGNWSGGRYKGITADRDYAATRKAALQDMMSRAGITSNI
jgi:hypothetical protein